MGKKSRMKREATATAAVPPVCTPPLLVLVKPAPMTDAELLAEIKQALIVEAENEIIERRNNLPFSHPENTHKLGETFNPLEEWMDQMAATGLSDATEAGVVIFKPRGNDEWYPITESFLAVCDTYELIAAERKIPDESGPLRRLANMINVRMPVSQREIDAAKETIAWMKTLTLPMTPVQFSDFTVAIQVRATLLARNNVAYG